VEDGENGEFLVKSINCSLTVMIYGREFFGAKRKKNYFKYCNLELGDPKLGDSITKNIPFSFYAKNHLK